MTGCTETLLHRTWCPDQDKRVADQVTREEDGLAYGAIFLRHSGVTRRKRTRRSFAMNADTPHLLIGFVFFHLGDVVAYVVDQCQILGTCLTPKDSSKGLPHPVHPQLPVRPGKLGATSHGCKVRLPVRL